MLLNALYGFAQRRNLFDNVHLQGRMVHLLIPLDMDGKLTRPELLPLSSPDDNGKETLGQKRIFPRMSGRLSISMALQHNS